MKILIKLRVETVKMHQVQSTGNVPVLLFTVLPFFTLLTIFIFICFLFFKTAVPLVTRSILEVVIPEYAVPKLITKSSNKLAQISEVSLKFIN